MIISRTPFRISFFGGGTDYPAWYRQHGGAVVAATINKYSYITCRYLPPFFEHRIRVVYSKVECCQSIDEITHPAVREVLRYLAVKRGVEIHHDGDLPARSGIGSSSSFTVGLVNALCALDGKMLGKHQLASAGIHIEQDLLRETVGSQDQVLAAYGGLNHITFAQNGEFSVRPLTLSHARVQELSSHFLLFFTGIHRTASDVATTYVADMVSKREVELRTLGAMVDEAVSIMTGGQDLVAFGRLLHESWKIKRSLSGSVSNPAIEEIYDAALQAGAIGGKVIGAGGGGFMLFFVPPAEQAKVRDRLSRLVHVPFRFEFSGSQIIFFDPEEDYSSQDRS